MQTNELIKISDFIRMPEGTTWFFHHEDTQRLSRSIQSSATKSGGKVSCEVWVAICPKRMQDATKLVRATVLVAAQDRRKPGRRAKIQSN